MSIAFVAAGAAASGTGSAAVPYPAGLTAGNLLVLCVSGKQVLTNVQPTPTGFTLIPRALLQGGDGPSGGADTGNCWAAIFVKESDGTETGTLTVGSAPGGSPSVIGRMFAYSKTGTAWNLQATSGPQNTGGSTSWSVAGGGDPGFDSGDFAVVCSAINTDAFTYSAEAITASGATFGTVTERQDSGTNLGLDVSLVVIDAPVTAGPSTAAPTTTMTASGSATDAPAGASVFLRLREAAAAAVYGPRFYSAGDGVAGTSSVAVPYPSVVAGALLLLFTSSKPQTADTPSGWTVLATQNGGSGSGLDAGQVYGAVYSKIATGTETGNETVTQGGGTPSIYARMVAYIRDVGAWSPVAATVQQNTGGSTAWSVTLGSNPGLKAGDVAIALSVINTDAYEYLDHLLTATGATFESVLKLMDEGTAQGNDQAMTITDHPVVTGPATAAPVYSMTASGSAANNPAGATIVVSLNGSAGQGAVKRGSGVPGMLGSNLRGGY